ncbi:MAG: autotransporter outer membrane beta-barrel domain-containing protein, partial [Selenomonadales bacterium]|nr:autotransporter outer membrane beta-barrel domain-containing protein [Selenomonadales bacterium]
GDWTIGAAYSYTDGKSWFAEGTGENTHNVFSLYGTKMNDNGTFVDLVAKYGNLDYDYTLQGGVGNGDYDTDAYSFSAEVGKRITSTNGAWVEPQFQLTYGTVDSASFTTANRMNVHIDSADSFVARAGIVAGKPVHKGNIYLKASYLYDFDGEVDGKFSNGTRSVDISRDLGGGWWEVGFGANFDLSDATHLYLDFEKAIAGEVDVEWKWNAGIRYSF